MKKMIALLLAAIAVFSLVGCKAAPDAAGASAPVLTVATSPDFAPLEFVDTSKTGQDQFVGFDITLAKFIADELGMTLEIKPMSFDACQTAVQLGSVDLGISGFSWMPDRAENFEISDYYITGEEATEQIIVKLAANEADLSTAEAFSGLKVGAQAASLQEHLCNEYLPDDAEIMIFKDLNDAVLALQTGKIDALAAEAGNAEAIIANNPDVTQSGFFFEVDPLYQNNVILLQKGDTELLEKVNGALAKAMAEGLYAGWHADAKKLAGIETAADVSYDDEGNAITD